jgi:hypothetical protein
MLSFQLIAQRVVNPALGGLGSLPGPQFFSQLLPALISLAFVIGVIVFVFYFLWGTISWITAGGDKVAVETARHRLTHALVGLVFLLLTFAVLNFVECFFGIGFRDIAIGPFHISFVSNAICPSTGGPTTPPTTPTPTSLPPATATPSLPPGIAGYYRSITNPSEFCSVASIQPDPGNPGQSICSGPYNCQICSTSPVFGPQIASCGPVFPIYASVTCPGTILTPTPTPTLAPYLAFVTNTSTSGNLGGIGAANSICQTEASSSGLTGTFRAWMSTESNSRIDARDNILPTNTSRPYQRVDGVLIANNYADLLDGALGATLSITSTGATYTAAVWTGTDTAGVVRSLLTCNDWFATSGFLGGTGFGSQSGQGWTNSGNPFNLPCGNPIRLYCFQIAP